MSKQYEDFLCREISIKATYYYYFLVFTGRATAGIAITQQAILRFFAPQG